MKDDEDYTGLFPRGGNSKVWGHKGLCNKVYKRQTGGSKATELRKGSGELAGNGGGKA